MASAASASRSGQCGFPSASSRSDCSSASAITLAPGKPQVTDRPAMPFLHAEDDRPLLPLPSIAASTLASRKPGPRVQRLEEREGGSPRGRRGPGWDFESPKRLGLVDRDCLVQLLFGERSRSFEPDALDGEPGTTCSPWRTTVFRFSSWRSVGVTETLEQPRSVIPSAAIRATGGRRRPPRGERCVPSRTPHLLHHGPGSTFRSP